MEEKLIRSWAIAPTVKDWNVSGLGLVWFDRTNGTRRQIGPKQWEALAPQAEISFFRDDVIAAFNHDFSRILGRQSNNTLQLMKTSQGVQYSIQLNPEDPEHVSMAAKIKRGDVDGSSATFLVSGHEWMEVPDGEVVLYNKIQLIEIGPVSIPAMTKSTAVAASDGIGEYTKRLAETRRRLKI